jgi:DNA uptake protein ComE-like DNA-binding protein
MRANLILPAAVLSSALVLLSGCNSKPSSPDQVREKTAEATSELKENARAVAQGVREGLTRPSSDRPLDLNSASKSQLLSLPGITDDAADRIIAARPYSNTHELLDKRIISREEFNKIADSITVKN